MVPLLIGASWLLVVSMILGLCAAARDGDLQQDPSRSAAQDPSRSAAVRRLVRPGCGATITRVTNVEHATPDAAQIRTAPTTGRFTAVS
jgi:hypothetical protein